MFCHGSTDCNPVYRLPLNLVQSCSCLTTDALYIILNFDIQRSETITHSRGWPLVIPSPKWSVEQALKDFKHSLRSSDNDNYLINDIVAQAATITNDHTAKAMTEDKSAKATTEDLSKETDRLIPKTPEPYPDSAGTECTIV